MNLYCYMYSWRMNQNEKKLNCFFYYFISCIFDNITYRTVCFNNNEC